MSAHGYGAIRAVVKNSRVRYCMRCAQDLLDDGKLDCVTLKYKRENMPEDSDGNILLRDSLRYSYIVSPGGLLLEGQEPDQSKLNRLHCSACKKLLRDDCTDY